MILIYGLGLLGYTTAVCLASWGQRVVLMVDGNLPATPSEPGLASRLQEGLAAARITITKTATYQPIGDIAWITYDTPIDDLGVADIPWIRHACTSVLKKQTDGTLVLLSSQVRVGFASDLQKEFPKLRIVSAPENIRRGHALRDFETSVPVIGLPSTVSVDQIERIYQHGGTARQIIYVTPDTAEIIKHARNAYLAMAISFANEIEDVCQTAGVPYADVQEALHTDVRIGPNAYIRGGKADGRHLLRDIRYLLSVEPNLWVIREVLRSPTWLP